MLYEEHNYTWAPEDTILFYQSLDTMKVNFL